MAALYFCRQILIARLTTACTPRLGNARHTKQGPWLCEGPAVCWERATSKKWLFLVLPLLFLCFLFHLLFFFHVFTLEYPSFNSLPSTMPHERRSEFTKDRQGWASQVIILELKSASRGDAAGAAVVGSATLSPGTLPRSLVSLTSPLLLRSREQPRPHHADIASCSWNTLFCHALDKGM